MLQNADNADLLMVIAEALEATGALMETQAGNPQKLTHSDAAQSKWLTCYDELFDEDIGLARTYVNPFLMQDMLGLKFCRKMMGLFTDAQVYYKELDMANVPIAKAVSELNRIANNYQAFLSSETESVLKRKAESSLRSEKMESYE